VIFLGYLLRYLHSYFRYLGTYVGTACYFGYLGGYFRYLHKSIPYSSIVLAEISVRLVSGLVLSAYLCRSDHSWSFNSLK
jgi:membrane protease YdiL (CAAX protease family)